MKNAALIFITVLLVSCNPSPKKNTVKYAEGSFGYDLDFLKKYDSIIILGSGMSQVIVSPKYQAKVFTSTATGLSGNSFGWIHYSAFDSPLDLHMNAYGGENRLWLGPEGGRFSLFFSKGAKMEFTNWKTPAAFDNEPWILKEKLANKVTFEKVMQLTNYAGTPLSILIKRTVSILDDSQINALLNLTADTSINAVGYQTENNLENTGTNEWTAKTGMPCIWILDMFNPSDNTTVVIPYKEIANTKPATTDYFGEIAANRIKLENGTLFFRADGKRRGKLGIHPDAAKNIAGSYNADKKILTITLFDIDNAAQYLNQEWNSSKPPFSGDAVNAYNDGPLADGQQMGPFYEIESVSPAAFLKPTESLNHNHAVFHFTGSEKGLDAIAQKALGVSLSQIEKALK
ncbi:hypothetical protein BH11BAC3_BH11BAC3_27600 [soil metagenome]